MATTPRSKESYVGGHHSSTPDRQERCPPVVQKKKKNTQIIRPRSDRHRAQPFAGIFGCRTSNQPFLFVPNPSGWPPVTLHPSVTLPLSPPGEGLNDTSKPSEESLDERVPIRRRLRHPAWRESLSYRLILSIFRSPRLSIVRHLASTRYEI